MIYLEPRNIYDKAIKRTERNVVVYCFERLVDVLVEHFSEENTDQTPQELYTMAVEHIDYNIEGMRPYHANWPAIEDIDMCVSAGNPPH